jgi:hypothetical protein
VNSPRSGIIRSSGDNVSSLDRDRAHNCFYEPCLFYARKTMLHRFNFAIFSGGF